MYNIFPYVDQCTLVLLETLAKRRSNVCVMFVFDVFSGRVGSPKLLSLVNVIALRTLEVASFLMMRFGILMRSLV
jgi:hypothetical protein